MRIGIVAGIVLCLVGVVWIAQGFGAMHGSMMTGHRQYAALGGLAVLVGIALLGWSTRGRRGPRP
jgi:hypothetical protein